ncbi:helix-turn-helix transcriptional regulator [Haloglycomyces albus]|uniref:helix-turn-helix transcriptional regulator n=1 Tax=Haloglycomyces albus TaxID=526067 RepID=UPI00046D920B|nr:LuxR family transcriptional regulator [Haloglycomyces albus]
MRDRRELTQDVARQAIKSTNIYLHGPAGIGKTTIVDRVRTTLADHKIRQIHTCPTREERRLPNVILIDFISELSSYIPTLPPQQATILNHLLTNTHTDDDPDRMGLLMATAELLRRAGNDRPILIIIDDVQWVDESSAEVLSYVARRIDKLNATFLVCERSEYDSRTTPIHPTNLSEYEIPPLSDREASCLVKRTAPQLTPAQHQQIIDQAHGNPLHIVECADFLSRNSEQPLPRRLNELIAARITPHQSRTQWALLLSALSTRPTLDLLEQCDALPEHCLEPAELSDTIRISPDGHIHFRHPLLPELIQSTTTSSQARRAHHVLANAVDDPVIAARHLILSSPTANEDVSARAVDAADEAADRGAPAAAAELAELAARRSPCPHKAAERSLAAARFSHQAGNHTYAQGLAEAVARCEDARPRTRALLLLADLSGQNIDTAHGYVNQAAESTEGDVELEAEVALEQADIAYHKRDWDASLAYAKAAHDAGLQLGNDTIRLRAITAMASVTLENDPDEAFRLQDEAKQLADGLPLDDRTANTRQLWCTFNLFRGRRQAAWETITALENEARALGRVSELRVILISSATIYYRNGDCERGLAAGRECLDLSEGTGLQSVGEVMGALTEWAGGSFESALSLAQQAFESCQSAGDREWFELASGIAGMASNALGNHTEALRYFADADDAEKLSGHGDPAVCPWHSDYVEALAYSAKRDQARDYLDRLTARVHQHQRQILYLPLARAEAAIRCAAGDMAGAYDLIDAAVKEHGASAEPLEVGRAHLIAGRIAHRLRRRSVAEADFKRATKLFGDIGAEPWRELARQALGQTSLTVEDSPLASLGPTDSRIVELVSAGLTNSDIAATLFLSVKAVEGRLTRLYRRFGVNNRAELVAQVSKV